MAPKKPKPRPWQKKQQLLSLGGDKVVHLVWHVAVPLPCPGWRADHPFQIKWLKNVEDGDTAPLWVKLPLSYTKTKALSTMRKIAVGKVTVVAGEVESGDSLELVD